MKFLSINILIFTLFVLLSGCNQPEAKQGKVNELWTYEEEVIKNGKTIDTKPYNEGIEKATIVRLPWAYSPITIALKVAGQQMISPEVNLVAKSLSGPELVTETAVLIEKKNLPDDSVSDEYFWIKLKLGGTIWRVTEIKHAWKCREGRGHTALSGKKCE